MEAVTIGSLKYNYAGGYPIGGGSLFLLDNIFRAEDIFKLRNNNKKLIELEEYAGDFNFTDDN